MTEQDYRLYLEEKFAALNTHMNAQFVVINDKLEEINQHVQKTNGRVTELEKVTTDLKVKEITHIMNCPNVAKIDNINKDLIEYRMFLKYPKLFIAGIIILIILNLSVFAEKIPDFFKKEVPKTEISK